MKNKFYKAAKEIGVDILSYESFRIEGCQEYDITASDNMSCMVYFKEAVELGASQKDKDNLIELFKQEFI